jgi:hypothetical protein
MKLKLLDQLDTIFLLPLELLQLPARLRAFKFLLLVAVAVAVQLTQAVAAQVN